MFVLQGKEGGIGLELLAPAFYYPLPRLLHVRRVWYFVYTVDIFTTSNCYLFEPSICFDSHLSSYIQYRRSRSPRTSTRRNGRNWCEFKAPLVYWSSPVEEDSKTDTEHCANIVQDGRQFQSTATTIHYNLPPPFLLFPNMDLN